MDSLLDIKPGQIIWSIVIFLIFLFILKRIGFKPMVEALKNREDTINQSLENAEKANLNAKKLMEESQQKLDNAHLEMAEIINKGKEQADNFIKKATDEAEKIKKEKLEEATNQIQLSKEAAIRELRSEVADLVIEATEKLLEEKLDKEKDSKLVESYINKLPNN